MVPFRVGDHIRSPTVRDPFFFLRINFFFGQLKLLDFAGDVDWLPSVGGKKGYK